VGHLVFSQNDISSGTVNIFMLIILNAELYALTNSYCTTRTHIIKNRMPVFSRLYCTLYDRLSATYCRLSVCLWRRTL